MKIWRSIDLHQSFQKPLLSWENIHFWIRYSIFNSEDGFFCCNIPLFLFNIKGLNILYILKAARGVCAYVWTGHLCLSVQDVTKHGDRSPSPTGINWVSDGVSIDSKEIYVYRKCLLLAWHRVIDDSYLLRKKQSNSNANWALAAIKQACKASGETEFL